MHVAGSKDGVVSRTVCSTLCVLMVSFALCFTGAAMGADELEYELDIPQLSLDEALKSLARQVDVQLLFPFDLVRTLNANPVKGRYTLAQALEILLEDTGLAGDLTGSGVITISRVTSVSAPEARVGDTMKTTSKAGLVAIVAGTLAGGVNAQEPTEDEQELDKSRENNERNTRGQIETIVVVGSRNAGIRRYEDDAQPYVIFESSEIETSFSTNIEDFLKTNLPQNATEATFSQNGNDFSGNRSQINLRGLGSDQTLILVNGRRLPGIVTTGGDFDQGDINGIPLSSVERIEVLPATAAGIYGGGATGGAINIITKRDYAGYELSIGYENTFDGDMSQRRIGASAGFDLEGGRANIFFSGSYSESDPLRIGEREFGDKGRALQFANNPDAFLASRVPQLGFTTNIRNRVGENLILDDGADLGSPITYVPVGYAGVASDGGAALVENAGQHNLNLADDVRGALGSLLNNPRIASLTLNTRREFTSKLELFWDTSYYRNQGRDFATNIGANAATLDADAPNNPFTTDVRVRYPIVGVSPERISESELVSTMAGAVVTLSDNWSGQLEYGWSRSRTETRDPSPSIMNVTPQVSAGEIDVMRDLNEFPINWAPFTFAGYSEVLGPSDIVLSNISARVSGPIFELPGGSVMMSGLLERRETEAKDSFLDRRDSSGNSITLFNAAREQNANSIYLETVVPFVGKLNAKPGIETLELQFAARYDDYTTTTISPFTTTILSSRDDPTPDLPTQEVEASSTDFTIGLRYSPKSDVLLRASYGTGFLPPSIQQLLPFENSIPLVLNDPKREGVPSLTNPISWNLLGNADLSPEDSESLSIGFVFTPSFAPGLRFSADYIRIDKTDEIVQALNIFNIFDFEEQFPGRISRAPLTPEDAALGYTGGEVIALDTSFVNVAESLVEAYDFQLDYSIASDRMGIFNFRLVATHQTSLANQILPDADAVDSVGFSGGPLETRGNLRITWENGPLTVGWNAQYFDSYLVYSATASDAARESAILSQGDTSIPSQTYHDLFLKYDLEESQRFRPNFFSDTEIRVGVQNVLDESPPIIASTISSQGYSFYGDPRLRRFSLEVRTRF